MNRDQLAARLLSLFREELADQVRQLNAELLALEAAPGDAEHLRAVFRIFHTLKGAARAANVPVVEQLSHELETLLASARSGRVLDDEQFAMLFEAADALSDAAARLQTDAALTGSRAEELLRRWRGQPAEAGPVPPAAAPGEAESTMKPSAGLVERSPRIAADKLDPLLSAAAELAVTTQRVLALQQDLRELRERAMDCALQWQRGSSAIRAVIERAELKTDAPRQTLHLLDENMRRLATEMQRVERKSRADTNAVARVSDTIAWRAQQLRMRPFSEIAETLPRAVRDIAHSVDKQVTLQIDADNVQADRAVLNAIADALLQLVRNAIDHGIEAKHVRLATGKPAAATLRIRAELSGNQIRVAVEDDGAGFDFDALRAELMRRGVPAPTDQSDLIRLLIQHGISTRAQATSISGRGVGLDIVHNALARVHGTVQVHSVSGRGTSFVLTAPTSVATVRALIVRVDQQRFALPVARVTRVLRIPAHGIKRAQSRDIILSAGEPVPLVSLAHVLGPPLVGAAVGDASAAAVITAGERALAVAVDELLNEQDLLVRTLEDERLPPHISGAAQLADGGLTLLLNVDSVVNSGWAEPAAPRAAASTSTTAADARLRVLVADDSITTRTLEQSVLEAAGYEVLTAVDGADAWRIIQERGCDLLVSDVEMPRMDGLALCQAVRNSKRFQHLPIVLVSALETPEQRSRGLHVGADAYLGKSSFDQQRLLELVAQLIGSPNDL